MRRPYHPPRNQRLERFLYSSPGQPVFFTIRAYRNASPFANAELAQDAVDCLLEERDRHGCDVYAYCLMPDHIHILVCPRNEVSDTLAFVDRFKGKSTRISWRHGSQGKLWQPRSYDHLVRKEESLLAIAEYVLLNPVRRGLAERWDEYPWCGLPDAMPV